MSIRDRVPAGAKMMDPMFDDCIVGIQDCRVLYNASKMIKKMVSLGKDEERSRKSLVWSIKLCRSLKLEPRFYWEI